MPSEKNPQRPAPKGKKIEQPGIKPPTQEAPPHRRGEPEGAYAVITRRAAERLLAGHVWVYQSDIDRVVAPEQDSSLIQVLDPRGVLLGTALYSGSSQIALRLVSTGRLERDGWGKLFQDRLRAAIAFRKKLLLVGAGQTDACRLVFSEADFLPGLIVDKYADLVVLQTLTQGMNSGTVRDAALQVLSKELNPRAIFERSDPKAGDLEQPDEATDRPVFVKSGESSDPGTTFQMNGLRFHYDAGRGQKTGSFLDQRENYVAAEAHCRGETLDVCTYHGGFALHLARAGCHVTAVDASRAALEVAEQNLSLNQEATRGAEVEWIEANAFDLLREWSDAGRRFDSIVLDPPAFAKSKRAVDGALRGYKELNLRAIKMLRPEGTLVTCSCSHHVSAEAFTGAIASAAGDARRQLRLLERRGAATDHPVLLGVPETEYLKCFLFRTF